jgi:hypothetical protein
MRRGRGDETMTTRHLLYLAIAITLLALTGILSAAAAELSDVSPAEGTVGTELTLTGSGFGETRGQVLLGEELCRVSAWSDTRIVCTVSRPQLAGEYTVTVVPPGDRRSPEPLTFSPFTLREPEIAPGELARDGDTVTIAGAFFGDRKGEVVIAYRDNGVVVDRAKVEDWSTDAIRIRLPAGLTGRFIVKVQNAVGKDFALFDLGDGPPMLTLIPDPVGYGDKQSLDNARGIYYNGQLHVFSIWYDDTRSIYYDKQYLIEHRTFRDHQLSGPGTLWGGKSYVEPAPLVVQYPNGPQKMFVFVTGKNGNLYFTRLNGDVWEDGDWLRIKDSATGQYITMKDNKYEVAPVFNPITNRISVFYSRDYNDYLYYVYSDNFGNDWKLGGRVYGSPVVQSAPSATFYVPPDRQSDVILAVKDSNQDNRVCYIARDSVVRSEVMVDGDVKGQGRPFLADLGPDAIALMYGQSDKASDSIYEQYYIPYVVKLNKATGAWGTPYKPASLPDVIGLGREYRYEWSPNGAVMYEPNGSGGYDRVFYLFFGYQLILWDDGNDQPHWMFTAIENLGP